ncbi:hypothetical protein Rsub_12760 [Raphidocelis subcapitata]|uniref:AP2/ERF domain-containing protein n=1 Tax=Raphidocelis subcapitata TaxID=307507 RepID=A0A2V0PKF5_9CHLO|nr:hypothetical protein Rsub_12760 [Raphidocelis subcapitata]|eukprot:GBG00030.1 hypothetical protein Rsub_12760 [Raphidocelis subcapitata]
MSAGEGPPHEASFPLATTHRPLAFDRSSCTWRVRVSASGKQISLGRYRDELDAAAIYDAAAFALHGARSAVNFGAARAAALLPQLRGLQGMKRIEELAEGLRAKNAQRAAASAAMQSADAPSVRTGGAVSPCWPNTSAETRIDSAQVAVAPQGLAVAAACGNGSGAADFSTGSGAAGVSAGSGTRQPPPPSPHGRLPLSSHSSVDSTAGGAVVAVESDGELLVDAEAIEAALLADAFARCPAPPLPPLPAAVEASAAGATAKRQKIQPCAPHVATRAMRPTPFLQEPSSAFAAAEGVHPPASCLPPPDVGGWLPDAWCAAGEGPAAGGGAPFAANISDAWCLVAASPAGCPLP